MTAKEEKPMSARDELLLFIATEVSDEAREEGHDLVSMFEAEATAQANARWVAAVEACNPVVPDTFAVQYSNGWYGALAELSRRMAVKS